MTGPSPEDRPRYFSLFISDRLPGLLKRHKHAGISLDSERLRWRFGGYECMARLEDITEIRLATSMGGYASATGVCEITFRPFNRVLVFSSTAFGNTDATRNTEYNTFVNALHRALPPEVRKSARFSAGHRRAESPVFKGVAYTLVAVVSVLMIVVAFNVSGPKRIIIPALAGGFMLWPLIRLLREGSGGTYNPTSIPHALLP